MSMVACNKVFREHLVGALKQQHSRVTRGGDAGAYISRSPGTGVLVDMSMEKTTGGQIVGDPTMGLEEWVDSALSTARPGTEYVVEAIQDWLEDTDGDHRLDMDIPDDYRLLYRIHTGGVMVVIRIGEIPYRRANN